MDCKLGYNKGRNGKTTNEKPIPTIETNPTLKRSKREKGIRKETIEGKHYLNTPTFKHPYKQSLNTNGNKGQQPDMGLVRDKSCAQSGCPCFLL